MESCVGHRGATLTSFLVAATLSGLLGLAIVRLTSQQGEALLVVSLVDERERLLKHYANMVVEGWDKTRPLSKPNWSNTGIPIYDRSGSEVISSAGEELGTHNEWTIKAIATDITSPADVVMGSDPRARPSTDYHTGGTIKATKVRLVITFDPAKHPIVKSRLAQREEWLYLHNAEINPALNTNCIHADRHPSQKEVSGTPPVTKDLYPNSGEGALTQFDFASNHAKCSYFPLIKNKSNCPLGHPIVGFSVNSTAVPPLSAGEPICSANHVSIESGKCLGDGSFISSVNKSGVVTCSDNRYRVAIMRPVGRRSSVGCNMSPYSDTEHYMTGVGARGWRPAWVNLPINPWTNRRDRPGHPLGMPRRTNLWEAGGFRGIGRDGRLLGCETLSPSSKGNGGVQGPDGLRGFRGPTGPRGDRGEKGPDGPLTTGDTGVTGPKGLPGSCYSGWCCVNDASCEKTLCDGRDLGNSCEDLGIPGDTTIQQGECYWSTGSCSYP